MSRYRMASGDAAWLHMDRPVNELIVNAVLWFDAPLDDETLRLVIKDRLVGRFPRFGQRVDDRGAAAWWVDDADFDPQAHVVHEQLDAPADLAQLARHVTHLIAKPLARDRPLWQIHVVDGFNGSGTALVARIHHCIADGVALLRVLLSLSDEAHRDRPAARTAPALHSQGTAPAAPLRSRAGGLVRRARDVGVQALRGGLAFAELVVMSPDSRTALRRPLGTAKTVVWSAPIPLEAMHTASRAVGATINDLVLAALAGALRRHLDETGCRVRDVRAVLPVNLRSPDTDVVELGNRFGLVFLRLPVVSDDPKARIALIQRRTAALKRSATPVVTLGILRVAGYAPYRCIQLLTGLFAAKASAVVTNVPGPTTALHLGGRRLAGAVAWPPQSGSIGLGVSVISYAGNVVVGVMADDRIIPDTSRLLAATCAELEALGVRLVTLR